MPTYRGGAAGFAAIALSLLAGCASVKPEAAFRDVQATVAARTGRELQWIRNEEASGEIEQRVRSLLEKELSADAAVQIALLNNRALQATFEELGISQADLVQAGLLKNPQFGISARFPNRPPSAANMEFALSDDLLDLFILPLRKRIAAQQLEQTKLRVGNEVLKLCAEAKSAFYTVQAREQLLGRLRLIMDANKAAAELSQKQHEAGTVNELDLINQQVLDQQSRLELAQAEAQAGLDREKLSRLLGLAGANTEWKAAAQLPEIPQEEFALGELEALALSQRLDLAAAREHVALAGRAVSLKKKTRLLPAGVDLGVSAERDTGKQWVRGPTLQLGLPIFDQGQAQVARLEAELRQTQRIVEALEAGVRSEVRAANALLNANRAAARTYGTVLLPQRARILDLTLQHYNFMLKGTYDLLLAKQQEAQTERASIETRRDYWIARSELERAVGGKLPVGRASVPVGVDPDGHGGPSYQPPATEKKEDAHEHHHKKGVVP